MLKKENLLKEAIGALVGAAVMLIFELICAFFIEKGILSSALLSALPLVCVFIGALASAIIAGGKLGGFISALMFLVLLLILGALVFGGEFCAKNVLFICGMSVLGACAGAVFKAARK